MQKQYILNRNINNWFTTLQTENLKLKVKRAKSLLNFHCPESYTFFKGSFKEGKSKNKCN